METKEVEANVTRLFRLNLVRFGSNTNAKNYEFSGGELWYGGYPMLDKHMTDAESKALEFAIGETLNVLGSETH